MNDKLIAAAKALLFEMADQNGNIFSVYTDRLHFKRKIKINRIVKNLFNEIQKAEKCQTNALK
jgi:hypothetical protein